MASIDFPASPAVDDTVTLAGVTYTFNGTGWTSSGGGGAAPVDAYTKAESDAIEAAQDAKNTTDFVNVTGDTMTGILYVGTGAASISPAGDISGKHYIQLRQDDAYDPSATFDFSNSAGASPAGVKYNFTNGEMTLRVNGIDTRIDSQGSLWVPNNGAKPGGGDWWDSSDSRIKTVQGNYTQGLAALKQLNPVVYKFNGNDTPHQPEPGRSTPYPESNHAAVLDREFIGLVAQQAEGPMPELVKQTTGYIDGVQVNDLRMLDGSALTYALINAVKELSAELDAVKAQLAATRR